MKVLAKVAETTIFMTVEIEKGVNVEDMRNPFGEWNQPSTFGEDFFRVDSSLAKQLEELYTNEKDTIHY